MGLTREGKEQVGGESVWGLCFATTATTLTHDVWEPKTVDGVSLWR